MLKSVEELKFLATPEKGEVSALLTRPEDAMHLLVLGHGASSNMRSRLLQTIAENLADQKIATFGTTFLIQKTGAGAIRKLRVRPRFVRRLRPQEKLLPNCRY